MMLLGQKINPETDKIYVCVLTLGTKDYYQAELRENELRLVYSPTDERFTNLKIALSNSYPVSYTALEKNPTGYRFFNMKDVNQLEIGIFNDEIAKSKSSKKFTMRISDNNKIVKIELMSHCEYITLFMYAAWDNGKIYLKNKNNQIINRTGTYEEFINLIQKLNIPKVRNFL